MAKDDYDLIRKELIDKDNNIRPILLYQLGMKGKIKKRDAKEIWIDGSFEKDKTSYAILFDSNESVSDILPSLNKQSNNRGELTAFLIAIWMTRDVTLNKIYTDSSYVKYIFDKIQINDINKEKNLDIIEEIKKIVIEQINRKHVINVIHINSHLLDKNKEVKNKNKKIEDMKNKLGNEFNRILGKNKEVDKLAQKALKFKRYDGFFINSNGRDWNMKYQKKYYDSIQDIKQLILDKQEQSHNDNYYNIPIRKLKREEIDWKASTKLYNQPLYY